MWQIHTIHKRKTSNVHVYLTDISNTCIYRTNDKHSYEDENLWSCQKVLCKSQIHVYKIHTWPYKWHFYLPVLNRYGLESWLTAQIKWRWDRLPVSVMVVLKKIRNYRIYLQIVWTISWTAAKRPAPSSRGMFRLVNKDWIFMLQISSSFLMMVVKWNR